MRLVYKTGERMNSDDYILEKEGCWSSFEAWGGDTAKTMRLTKESNTLSLLPQITKTLYEKIASTVFSVFF